MNADYGGVEVLIPYARAGELRRRALSFVLAFYADWFPAWKLTIATDEEQPFNRGRALNQAVASFATEIVVINDADALCDQAQVLEAVRLAREAPGYVFAYTLYLRLSEHVTAALADYIEALEAPAEWGMVNAPSGSCSAIRRDDYRRIGGFDERFAGWGYEDLEWNMRCDRYANGCRRVPGELRHLWHGDRRPDDSPLSADPVDVARNWQLYRELVA